MRSYVNTWMLGGALFALVGCPWDEAPAGPGDCAQKTCGTVCRVCDPNDQYCVEPEGTRYCQPDGMCVLAQPLCGAESPCSDAVCPGGTSCVELDTLPASYECMPVPLP